jgi:hypothetical protein
VINVISVLLETLDSQPVMSVLAMLKELLITIATLQLDTASATLTLLETAAMLVSLEHSISQLVKHVHVIPKDQ